MQHPQVTKSDAAVGQARNHRKLTGPKPPVQPKYVWAIRIHLLATLTGAEIFPHAIAA